MSVYSVLLTGPQLRILHELLSVVMNDPYWYDGKLRDHGIAARAHEAILDAWREAARAESSPA